LKSACLN